jgi:hypothetical protein
VVLTGRPPVGRITLWYKITCDVNYGSSLLPMEKVSAFVVI